MQSKFDKLYYFGGVYEDYDKFLDFEKLADDLIKNYTFDSFLDVGCGCGNLVKEIKKQLEERYKRACDVQGIDFSEFAVDRAGEPYVTLADCSMLPFQDEQFELVYILGTFGYLETKEELLKAMSEAYRVSSKFIVFEDVYNIPDFFSDDYDPHRVQFLNKKGWLYTWKEVLNDNDYIKFNKDELVITKDYEP